MPIRAIIFDFGGVLVHTEDWSHHRRWETQLGLQEGELLKRVFGADISTRASIGEATVAEVWQHIATTFRLNAEQVRQLQLDFFANELLNEELVGFLRSLRPHYKTAILSNAWPDARDIFGRKYNVTDLVDVIINSAEEGLAKPDPRIFQLAAEEGLAKPDPRIFQLAAERLDVHPSEAIL